MPTLSGYFSAAPFKIVDSTLNANALFGPVTHDLNGDGNSDLLILGAFYPGASSNYSGQPGRVLFGDGQGNFTPVSESAFPVSSLNTVHPRKVLFADFNGDGRDDFFVSSHGWDAMPFPGEQNRLYLSTSSGGFSDATSRLPQVLDFSHSSATGDIDGDGDIDIFVGNGYDNPDHILPYTLINDGKGNFTQSQSNIPVHSGGLLDPRTSHLFPGSTLTDLNNDGLPELLITADATTSFNKLSRTTILWNKGGTFGEDAVTLLPVPAGLPSYAALDVQRIDFNGDARQDLVVIGTNGNPFYDGAFVQLLRNDGNNVFTDVTATSMPAADALMASPGTTTGNPWAMWVKVLDFNNDGAMDFAVEYNRVQQSTPLVWLNDGTGKFTTLKVSDFVNPGEEWMLGGGHFYPTANGYSIVTTQFDQSKSSLITIGLLASKPYLTTTSSANNQTRTTSADDIVDSGAGVDMLVMNGNRSGYTLTKLSNGYQVQDSNSSDGADGTDTLLNIERIRFADTNIALDIDGNAGKAYRLYQAAFNRTPDLPGLGWQMKAIDAGMSLLQVSQNFMDSGEFQSLYGNNLGDSAFVTQLYQNVLHRTPVQNEIDFWVGILHGTVAGTAQQSRAQVLYSFSESPENQAQVIGSIQNGIEYQYFS